MHVAFEAPLHRLTKADVDFVVIGSAALALHGIPVVPLDLDLMTADRDVGTVKEILDVPDHAMRWVNDGEARRAELETEWGPLDVYVAVSGGLSYDEVRSESTPVDVDGARIFVGSLDHARHMRAAASGAHLASEPEEALVQRLAVLAIDGPAGAGKSTVAKVVASRLGFTYFNSGAMYRCVGLSVVEGRYDPDDIGALRDLALRLPIAFSDSAVLLDGRDVSADIRRNDVTRVTAHVAAYPEVRSALIRRQREMFATTSYVAEGRDTGTDVVPEAPLKIFLTSSVEERARRRALETGEDFETVLADVSNRDRLDSERAHGALRPAHDAIHVDTTGRSIEDVVEEIYGLACESGLFTADRR